MPGPCTAAIVGPPIKRYISFRNIVEAAVL